MADDDIASGLKGLSDTVTGVVKTGVGALQGAANWITGGGNTPAPGGRTTWDTPEGKMTTDKAGNPVPVQNTPTGLYEQKNF